MNQATEPVARDIRARYGEIYRYVRRRSRSDMDAEDVTQDVFADAARALERLEPGSAPPIAWLYKVAQRRLVDQSRRLARRRRELSGDTALELAAGPAPEYGWELTAALQAGIERLPRPQQQVIRLKLVHGRSFAEIAATVGASEGACRMRFLRGLEQLRAFLEEQEVEP